MRLVDGVKADAVLSPCGTYRYMLTRDWWPKDRGHVLFVMLNPSTADATVDDPTVRKCATFARLWGYDGISIVNLFAYRATRPADLEAATTARPAIDIVGPANDDLIEVLLDAAGIGLVVAAWGAHRIAHGRGRWLRRRAAELEVPLHVLGFTQHADPRHPLYCRADTEPTVWETR